MLSRSKPRSDSSEPNRPRSWLYGYSVNVHFFIAGSSLTPDQIFSVGVPSSFTYTASNPFIRGELNVNTKW